jgi:hypothetical protein
MNSKVHTDFAHIVLLLLREGWLSGLLVIVEFLALHGNVLAEVLISVHASSKVAIGFWSFNKCLGSSEEQGNNIC